MSALTDLFTSLANKIRSKLGTTSTYTPAQAIAAIDNVYTKGVTDTKKGNAKASDVLAPKTFTSTNGVGLTGSIQIEATTCTPNATQQTIIPSSGNLLGSVVVSAVPSTTGSASPSTSSQTKYPSAGKYFSSFTVLAISPQRSAGTTATNAGTNSTGPYVWFPYGWWDQADATYGSYVYLTEAQAQVVHKHTSTATPTGSDLNNSQYNLGEYHSYRYVNTAVCYNAGMHFGIESFLQGLSRTAYWFTIDNTTGGTVTTSGNTAMFGSITYGIIVITNRNTQAFINLIVKYKTNYRFFDYQGGTNQNAYIESATANENSMIIRVASGTDEFFNTWVYNI